MRGDRGGTSEPRRRRLWLTIGEVASIGALAIAVLSYLDNRRQHQAQEQALQTQAHAPLVLVGTADDKGHALMIAAAASGQILQSQRYQFPSEVLDHPMEVTAARPQIDLAWVAHGLDRALDAAHAPDRGEARLPVAIVTTYLEDGTPHTDRAVYVVGVAWHSRLLVGRALRLQGLALGARSPRGDATAIVERRWAAERARLGHDKAAAASPAATAAPPQG